MTVRGGAEAVALAELASESLLAAILGACAAAPVVSALRWLLRVAPASPWSATRGVKRAGFGGGASTHSSALGVYISAMQVESWAATCRHHSRAGSTTPVFEECYKKAPTRTVARCFRPAPPERSRRALVAATRFAITLYMDLLERRIFTFGVALADWRIDDVTRSGAPIQDPTGALFGALLAIRFLHPGEESIVPGDEALVPQLTFRCRRRLGAAVAIMHKYLINAPPGDRSRAMLRFTHRLLTAEEAAKWDMQLRLVAERQVELEAEMLSLLPWFAIHGDNPLTAAEHELELLCYAGVLPEAVVITLRGAAFFFLAACLLDPDADVLEQLSASVSTAVIGRALVSVLLLCARHVAQPDERNRYKFPHAVDQCAVVLLAEARAPHAAQLRVGPYAEPGPGDETSVGHITARATLEAAWAVFQDTREVLV